MLYYHLFYNMAEKGKKPESHERILQKLGQRIKAIRESKGYTSYEKFAIDHQLNRVQFWRCETGNNITFETLLKVLDAFDMTLQEFFSEGFD